LLFQSKAPVADLRQRWLFKTVLKVRNLEIFKGEYLNLSFMPEGELNIKNKKGLKPNGSKSFFVKIIMLDKEPFFQKENGSFFNEIKVNFKNKNT